VKLSYYWAVILSSFVDAPLPGVVIPKHSFEWDDQSYDAFLATRFVGDQLLTEALKYHNSRFEWFRVISTVILFFVSTIVVYPLALRSFYAIRSLTRDLSPLSYLPEQLTSLMVSSVVYLLMFVSMLVIFRLAILSVNRYFAESLCVINIVRLLSDLSYDGVLRRSDRRKLLQSRVNYLAQKTLLLGLRYASRGERTQEHIEEHFQRMEAYIREREAWIITPREDTLEDLRKDFYELSKIYVSGNYGAFDWQAVETPTPSAVLPPSSWVQRTVSWVLRLLGMALPLILLGFLLLDPERMAMLRLDPNVVALIFVTWFMLAVDAILGLGVVANVLGLAKQIKDLK
jgi:hypothetical protein